VSLLLLLLQSSGIDRGTDGGGANVTMAAWWQYYYQVGDPVWDWSFHSYSFKTAPTPTVDGRGYRHAAIYLHCRVECLLACGV